MPKGSSDILDLRLSRLQGTVESFMTPPNLVFSNMFISSQEASDSIEWETIKGSRGLTPFVAPGSPAPMTSPLGHGDGRALAAYWKEKIFYDENYLNNLRQVGTRETYEPARRKLARDLLNMTNRCKRRKEWMFAKMFCNNGFTYVGRNNVQLSVSYGIPTEHRVTLDATRKWDTGTKRNIVEDIFDAKISIQDSIGAKVTRAMCTSNVLKLMVLDTAIQTLAAKQNFGNGDLFSNSNRVLSAILGIPQLEEYDGQFQLTAWLTAAVTGGATTNIYLDDTSDIEAGETLRIYDITEDTYEDLTVSSVTHTSGYVTVSTPPTNSYKAGEDMITVTKNLISSKPKHCHVFTLSLIFMSSSG